MCTIDPKTITHSYAHNKKQRNLPHVFLMIDEDWKNKRAT